MKQKLSFVLGLWILLFQSGCIFKDEKISEKKDTSTEKIPQQPRDLSTLNSDPKLIGTWHLKTKFDNGLNEFYESTVIYSPAQRYYTHVQRYYLQNGAKDVFFDREYDSTLCTYTVIDNIIDLHVFHPKYEEWQKRYEAFLPVGNTAQLIDLNRYNGTSSKLTGSWKDTTVYNSTYSGHEINDTLIHVISFEENGTFRESELSKNFKIVDGKLVWDPYKEFNKVTCTYEIRSDSTVFIDEYDNYEQAIFYFKIRDSFLLIGNFASSFFEKIN